MKGKEKLAPHLRPASEAEIEESIGALLLRHGWYAVSPKSPCLTYNKASKNPALLATVGGMAARWRGYNMDNISIKKCSRCAVAKPATTEFFAKARHGKFQLASWCKACASEHNKLVRVQRRAERERNAPVIPEGFKACTRCKTLKPLDVEHFYRAKDKKSGFQSQCKECAKSAVAPKAEVYRARAAVWRRQNPDRVRETRKAYKASHSSEIRDRQRRYYIQNRQNFIARAALWQKVNPEKTKAIRRAHDQRRRAQKQDSPTQHRGADILKQLATQEAKCYWCGIALGSDYHVDHVVPLSRGGTNGPENIVCACPACNMSKGSKLPDEWAEWKAQYE